MMRTALFFHALSNEEACRSYVHPNLCRSYRYVRKQDAHTVTSHQTHNSSVFVRSNLLSRSTHTCNFANSGASTYGTSTQWKQPLEGLVPVEVQYEFIFSQQWRAPHDDAKAGRKQTSLSDGYRMLTCISRRKVYQRINLELSSATVIS